MENPVQVALAQAVTALPTGPGWWYEPKLDGHRMVLIRDADQVRCQARSGRDTTSAWPDLAEAGARLPPGTVLDGEAVIWHGGVVDFQAAQARAASVPARARAMARRMPASYAVWDILEHPERGDVRRLPYIERRALLVETVGGLGPPIQPVPATDDPEVARTWYDALRDQGVEGLVCKRARGTYTSGRIWKKLRHADTLDVQVAGYTGSLARPRALLVHLPEGGPPVLSQALAAPVSAQAAARLRDAPPGALAQTWDGVRYTTMTTDLTAEVLAGTTRHRVVTVVRIR